MVARPDAPFGLWVGEHDPKWNSAFSQASLGCPMAKREECPQSERTRRRLVTPPAHPRPGYPLSSCSPAEPDSVSPSSGRCRQPDARWQVPLDTRAMPEKTHRSIPLTLHAPEIWTIQPNNDSRKSRVNQRIPEGRKPQGQGKDEARGKAKAARRYPLRASALRDFCGPWRSAFWPPLARCKRCPLILPVAQMATRRSRFRLR